MVRSQLSPRSSQHKTTPDGEKIEEIIVSPVRYATNRQRCDVVSNCQRTALGYGSGLSSPKRNYRLPSGLGGAVEIGQTLDEVGKDEFWISKALQEIGVPQKFWVINDSNFATNSDSMRSISRRYFF